MKKKGTMVKDTTTNKLNRRKVIRSEALFESGIKLLLQKGFQVKIAGLTNINDYEADYKKSPWSLIGFEGEVDFMLIPKDYDSYYISEDNMTLLIREYLDGLNANDLADQIAKSGLAVFEWAILLNAYEEMSQGDQLYHFYTADER
jgi:hypothetical protein